jgi:NAD(P)-dependent dehydrogenase (short-subunit alcohol dehydrogenase family)
LVGRRAIVTGAAQGIGKAVALRLAKEGANVAVVDINEENAKNMVKECQALGVRAQSYIIDLRKVEKIEPLYEEIVKDFGGLDIAVHAAGVITVNRFLDTTISEWDWVMDINAKALFFCVQQAARHMVEGGNGGRIINISSITAKGSRPDYPVYAASKAAVNSITRSAATAFAKHQIKVNAVCPGFVSTTMWDQIDDFYVAKYNQPRGEAIRRMLAKIPLNRSADLNESAAFVAFLASPEADYITGQAINICGGTEIS